MLVPVSLLPYFLIGLALSEPPKQSKNDEPADKVVVTGIHDLRPIKRLDTESLCKNPAPTPANKWRALTAMAGALNSVDAPWNIHGGLLLGLVRSCSIFDYDLDFVVDRQWMQDVTNRDRLEKALTVARISRHPDHPTFGELKENGGYEENFVSSPQDPVELDAVGGNSNAFPSPAPTLQKAAAHSRTKSLVRQAMSVEPDGSFLFERGETQDNHHLLHEDGMKIDIFMVERFKDHYIWDLWVGKNKHNCYSKATSTQPFSWLGVTVNIPVPMEDVLTSAYGPEYMTPMPWRWATEPFTVGSCK